VDATEEDDFVDDGATEDEEDDEATRADEVDEVLEATDEEEDDEDENELDEADEETALEEGATIEEGATLDEDREITPARLETTDVGRTAIDDDDDDDEESTTAGQLLGFELMVSATLVRLKYASILRIFNTLSAAGGPCAQLLPLLQLFQIQDPGVVGTLSVIVCTRTPSMKNLDTPGSQSTLYSCQAVLASAGAATLYVE
jgi:hypothetical protein